VSETFLVGEPEGKTSLGRSRRRWEDSSRIGLKEVGLVGVLSPSGLG
jgi:hypothetical protein